MLSASLKIMFWCLPALKLPPDGWSPETPPSAEDNVEVLQQRLAELNADLEAQVAELQSSADPLTEELETIAIKPKKTGISVQLCALVWAPYWRDAQGTATPAWE